MTLRDRLFDKRFTGRLLLALQRALVAKFTAGDWAELGYETGEHEYIQGHGRLLRSLSFGDDDYGNCVFQVLTYFAQQNPDALQTVIDNPKVREVLARDAPGLLSELGLVSGHVPAVGSRALSSVEVVERALADADQLLHSRGALSSVDRLHTALHGYLRELCSQAGLPDTQGASITALFKQLQSKHPAFQQRGEHDNEISRILSGFGTVIDAINTVRNNASVAHPNVVLLDEPEATLAVNVMRTLFHYLIAKTRR